jgi:hypothetical protein
MVFDVTFNDISVISWRSFLLVEKTTDLSQVFVANKDIDQLKKCYKLVHLQNKLIYVCINGFNQHSINHKSK